jgi:hypothetical protein
MAMARIDMGTALLMAMVTGTTRKGTTLAYGTATTIAASIRTRASTNRLGEERDRTHPFLRHEQFSALSCFGQACDG